MDSYETLRRNLYDSVTPSWFRWISFDYRVTLGFGSIAGGLDPVNPVIRLPIEHGISSGTRDETTTRIRINDVLDNVDAIYESFKGEHPTKEHPLKKEHEAIKHRSGYQQKDRKPSQNDKTEHGMEKTVQNQGQSQKNAKVRVNTEESAVKPEPELKNTIG
ncbi:hypothetical protein Tco_0784456 [Tanacetum coccineum]